MFEGLTFKHWKIETQDNGVVHLIFDKADTSTNTFSRDVMNELGRAVERMAIEPPRGLVIYSGKENGFIAGAEISEFRTYKDQNDVYEAIRNGQKVFDALERLACPTAVAIDGFCMGGGTEMSLACDYRIASTSDKTRIGLPEVMLGIHPGWGGTVRMPQLIGAPDAMDLILSGRSLRAEAAKKMGVVDRLAAPEDIVATAEEIVLKRPPKHSPGIVGKLSNSFVARQALAPVLKKKVASKANPKHYPAPFAAIELWRKHGGNPRKMMLAEARSVSKLALTDTARNLVRVFFLREKLRSLGDAKAANINHVHVVGAGVMGGDIAAWSALQGKTVTLQDREEQYVKPALERAHQLFKKKLKKDHKVEEVMGRLRMDVAGDGVPEADLVIEAIFENLEAKQELFANIEPHLKDGAILATNTSSIPLEELRAKLKSPERLVGLHFFNPVAKMPLVEVVQHDQLDDEVFTRAAGYAKGIDRLPAPVASSPGFLVNRILMPYMLEAFRLYQEGVPGRVIDKAATSFGMPMGPVELIDQVGLDVAVSVSEVLSEHLGFEIPDGMAEMVDAGKRGKKDGEGFYKYEEGKAVKPEIPDGYVAPADVQDRLIMAFCNEAVTCLREEVVADSEILDAGVIFGTGFAPFRGGPYQYIQDTGPDVLKARLEQLAKQHGERFKPDEYWDELVAKAS